MIISVDPTSPLPPFEQLRAAVVALIERGQLQRGSRLPTVRQLSADLALAPGTVARAFRELEADGVIETRGRHGTFVTGLPRRSAAQREQRVSTAIDERVSAAAAAGLDEDDLVRRVRAAFG